jgi:hypothetical protein
MLRAALEARADHFGDLAMEASMRQNMVLAQKYSELAYTYRQLAQQEGTDIVTWKRAKADELNTLADTTAGELTARALREEANLLTSEALAVESAGGEPPSMFRILPGFDLTAKRASASTPAAVVERVPAETPSAKGRKATADEKVPAGEPEDLSVQPKVVVNPKFRNRHGKPNIHKAETAALEWMVEQAEQWGQLLPREILRKQLAERKGIGPTRTKRLLDWAEKAEKAMAEGRELPAYPTDDFLAALSTAGKSMPEGKKADKAAAGIVPPGSKAAEMLESGNPNAVAQAASETKAAHGMVDPTVNVKPSEKGFAFFPFGRGTKPDIVTSGSIREGVREAVGKAEALELLDPGMETLRGMKKMDELLGNLPIADGAEWTAADVAKYGATTIKAASRYIDRLRQFVNVERKTLDAPWADSMDGFVRDRAQVYTVRSDVNRLWLDERIVFPMERMLAEYAKTPEGAVLKAKMLQEMVAVLEGQASFTTIADPRMQEIVLNAREFLDAYKPVLEMWGIKAREGYFPHIFRALEGTIKRMEAEFHFKEPEVHRKQREDVRARFEKHRYSKAEDYSRDISDVLLTYMYAMEKVIAFRPLARTWEHMRTIYGVEGDSAHLGLAKTSKSVKKLLEEAGLNAKPIPKTADDWWTGQIGIWAGRPGALDKGMANITDAVVRRFKRDPRLRSYAEVGNVITRNFMMLNYLGALGFSPSAALKNLTQNIPTIAEIGFNDWAFGLKSVLRQRTKDGMAEFPHLIEELGVLESSFVKSIRAEVEGAMKNYTRQFMSAFQDLAFSMFQGSEFLLRGAAGIGAYKKAYDANLKELGHAKAHKEAIRWGKEMIQRTQYDYHRLLGPQAFSSQTIKALGQFARFQIGYLDYLQLVVRRGLGSKEAARIMPSMPGESGFRSMMLAAAGPFILSATLLAATGISMQDVESPMGMVPELPRWLVGRGVEAAGRAAGGVTGELKARRINRAIGTDTGFTGDLFDAMMGSLGPIPGQIASLQQLLTSQDREVRARALDSLGRGLPFPIAATRIMRYIDEDRDGFVRSFASKNRLWPSNRALTEGEKLQRLIGLQPSGFTEELEILRDQRFFEEEWASRRTELREDAIMKLANGEDPNEVVADILKGMLQLEDDFHVSFSMGEVSGEIKHIFDQSDLKASTTLSERRLDKAPFKLVRNEEIAELLGGVR